MLLSLPRLPPFDSATTAPPPGCPSRRWGAKPRQGGVPPAGASSRGVGETHGLLLLRCRLASGAYRGALAVTELTAATPPRKAGKRKSADLPVSLARGVPMGEHTVRCACLGQTPRGVEPLAVGPRTGARTSSAAGPARHSRSHDLDRACVVRPPSSSDVFPAPPPLSLLALTSCP